MADTGPEPPLSTGEPSLTTSANIHSVSYRNCSWCGESFIFDKLQVDIVEPAEGELEDSFYDLVTESLRTSIANGKWENDSKKMKFIQALTRLKTATNVGPATPTAVASLMLTSPSPPPASPSNTTILTMRPYDRDICHFCLQVLENEIDRETLQLHSENETFTKVLQSHEALTSTQGVSMDATESAADAELKRLEAEFEAELKLRSQTRGQKRELAKSLVADLDTEDSLVTRLNQLERQRLDVEKTMEADGAFINFAVDRHVHLQELRPYQLAFCIDTKDKIALINCLPVGAPSLSEGKYSWGQVNEGLGQAALLVSMLMQMAKSVRTPNTAVMTDFQRKRNCRIWSKGPISEIEETQNQNSSVKYPLYTEGEPKSTSILGRIFSSRKSDFDHGLQKFVYLVDILCLFVNAVDGSKPPNLISGELLHSPESPTEKCSILVSSTPYDVWTKACRMLLQNIHFLLLWFDQLHCQPPPVASAPK